MARLAASEKRFGTIAVEKGFITKEQLVEAMKVQVADELKGAGHRLIGSVLCDLGFMNADQVMDVLRCLDVKKAKPKEEKHEKRRKPPPRKPEKLQERRFGIIAVRKGFITPEQLVEALAIQLKGDMEGKPHRLIGSILFDQGHLTIEQIKEGLRALDRPFSEDEW